MKGHNGIEKTFAEVHPPLPPKILRMGEQVEYEGETWTVADQFGDFARLERVARVAVRTGAVEAVES